MLSVNGRLQRIAGEVKRRLLILFLAGAMQVALFAGFARAQASSFFDGFDLFDAARWTKGDHSLGRSYLDPNNVYVVNGHLRLKIPANTSEGAEIKSNELYDRGSYAARMRLPYAPSSITGFFLYYPPDHASEIDIEIYNDSSRRVIFATYSGGRQTHTTTMELPFDPTTGFHTYRFDRAPGSLKFYADGRLMKTWKRGLPKNPMNLYANTWFPTWLGGEQPPSDSYVRVDWIRYVQK